MSDWQREIAREIMRVVQGLPSETVSRIAFEASGRWGFVMAHQTEFIMAWSGVAALIVTAQIAMFLERSNAG